MIQFKWSEYKDKVAKKGSFRHKLSAFLSSGSHSYVDIVLWVKKNTDFIPESFTEDQTETAIGSQLEIMERYGAIKLLDDRVDWIG